MTINWTSRVSRGAQTFGRILRPARPASSYDEFDADARRMGAELDAIRARFPDHA